MAYKSTDAIRYETRRLIREELAAHGLKASPAGHNSLKLSLMADYAGKTYTFLGETFTAPSYGLGLGIDYVAKEGLWRTSIDMNSSWSLQERRIGHGWPNGIPRWISTYGNRGWGNDPYFDVHIATPDFEKRLVDTIITRFRDCADEVLRLHRNIEWTSMALYGSSYESVLVEFMSGSGLPIGSARSACDIIWDHRHDKANCEVARDLTQAISTKMRRGERTTVDTTLYLDWSGESCTFTNAEIRYDRRITSNRGLEDGIQSRLHASYEYLLKVPLNRTVDLSGPNPGDRMKDAYEGVQNYIERLMEREDVKSRIIED